MHEVLTVAQMAAADAFAVRTGVPAQALMTAAGRAVAGAILARFARQPVTVLCGPGDNGGDGYVAARALADAGWPVALAALAPPASGGCRRARDLWTGPAAQARADALPATGLIVDALFGAGLARPLVGEAAAIVAALEPARTIAVDLPSGVHGDGAPPDGPHAAARLTVTFHRKKPAHLLAPAAALCGEVAVYGIGIPPGACAAVGADVWENTPALWRLPAPDATSHKHARGRVAVWASGGDLGPSATMGAPRLAAHAALRAGAGWASLAAFPGRTGPLAAAPAALMVQEIAPEALADAMAGFDAVVAGPGLGRAPQARAILAACLAAPAAVVDADALTRAADDPAGLFSRLPARAVLTPHGGEFARLFPDLASGSRLERCRAAAARAGATVLLKGADTVIAAPDGRAAINVHATPHLATAGTGDVLAGVIGALLAQGMPAFEAAAAGAWLHGEAGRSIGRGLIADDLIQALPAAFRAAG